MARLVVNLLGIFHARQAGGPVLNLPTKRVQALLAYLCLRPGRLCTPANLAQLLEAEGPTSAVVLDALGALRTALGADSLVGVLMEAEGVGINRTAVDVDVLAFEQLVVENTPQSLERAVALASSSWRSCRGTGSRRPSSS